MTNKVTFFTIHPTIHPGEDVLPNKLMLPLNTTNEKTIQE